MLTISKKSIIASIGLATIAVLSQWGFWTNDIFSLGVNTSIVGAGFWLLLLSYRDSPLNRQDIIWLTPLWLVILSFSLFENPWLKLISLIILPIATGMTYSYRQVIECDHLFWRKDLISFLFGKTLAPLACTKASSHSLMLFIKNLPGGSQSTILKRILFGVGILIPTASIVLFLLASADEQFLSFIETIFTSLRGKINVNIIFKITFILLTTILILAMLYVWQNENNYKADEEIETNLDNIITGIVVTGILIIYIIFLYFQAEYLALDKLPIDFNQAEKIVKSGFWQLFFLSMLNAFMFFVVYKNTSLIVQIVLRAFILASGLILLSGCWRMALYVYWYGLSYEKFFASYTALYSLVVFTFLVAASFSLERKNIFRFIAISSLWFYAIATISPIEKIIFRTNIYLSENESSRINLYHLSNLSSDVLDDVKNNIQDGKLDPFMWRGWLYRTQSTQCQNRWFESNLSNLINCRARPILDNNQS